MLTALVLTHVVLATSSGGGFANGTVTLYYIIGIIAALGGVVIGGWKIYGRQKAKWTDEGVARARAAQVMSENSENLTKNTNAIVDLTANFQTLTTSFQAWTSKVTSDMNGLSHRLDRLERYQPRPRNKVEDQD